MPPWTPVAGWMSLDRLDDGEGLDSKHVLAFRITDDGAEKWSARMIRFKDKSKEALFGAAGCLRPGVPPLLRA